MQLAQYIKVNQVNDVQYTLPHQPAKKGKLMLSDYHLAIIGTENQDDIYLPHKLIDCIQYRSTGAYAEVNLKLKDFSQVKLLIASNEQARLLTQSLESITSIENVLYAYAFHYQPDFGMDIKRGWQCASVKEEFSRRFAYGDWRVSHANKDYKLCPSYPESLIVPATISDEMLVDVAKCREGGRLPIPVYCHGPMRSILLRSGQPLGVVQKRCKADQLYLNTLLPMKHRGFIRDTRSLQSATQALQKGGGFEVDQLYPQWRKAFLSLEPWERVNESFRQFVDACVQSSLEPKEWSGALVRSEWLEQLHRVLLCANEVAHLLYGGNATVLVHDAEGTDATLTITSLVQVILDPDARTLLGFQALIDREWLQGGHRFGDRCSRGPFTPTTRWEAPVFLQFCDCVWQLYQQYPSAFQFNATFLLELCRHVYCSEFGNFLCNSDKERQQLGIYEKTISLWSQVNHRMEQYMNPIFSPVNSINSEHRTCWASSAPQSIKLWRELYLKDLFDFSATSLATEKELLKLKEENRVLKTDTLAMRRLLCKLLSEAEELDLLDKVKK